MPQPDGYEVVHRLRVVPCLSNALLWQARATFNRATSGFVSKPALIAGADAHSATSLLTQENERSIRSVAGSPTATRDHTWRDALHLNVIVIQLPADHRGRPPRQLTRAMER